MDELTKTQEALVRLIADFRSCLVAFSGGVDSAVVAKAAQLALGGGATAVTAASASLAAGELQAAQELARQIGIRHLVVQTDELSDPLYTRNAPDRCYHCKSTLYSHMAPLASQCGAVVILNGANVDDLGDYRPGMQAAAEFQVRSPLIECGCDKPTVRRLAAAWDLPVWDKPATPCLSSRIAYGEEVTPERLKMIDAAEGYLRSLGLVDVRVRFHRGDLARIEAPLEQIARLAEPALRAELVRAFSSLGFRFVTIDLAGLRSGSLNVLVAAEPPLLELGVLRHSARQSAAARPE